MFPALPIHPSSSQSNWFVCFFISLLDSPLPSTTPPSAAPDYMVMGSEPYHGAVQMNISSVYRPTRKTKNH